jgi:hypothetical protein
VKLGAFTLDAVAQFEEIAGRADQAIQPGDNPRVVVAQESNGFLELVAPREGADLFGEDFFAAARAQVADLSFGADLLIEC